MSTKLGVNIDHVATLREARRAPEPDPVHAAVLAELAGAHGITVHLRQDRRHIRERDIELLVQTVKTRLNIEMAATDEMVAIAARFRPHMCTLVPEKPEEVTTTGGLNVMDNEQAVRSALLGLRQAGIGASLFIDPDREQIQRAHEAGARMIEINTGRYADLVPADLEHAAAAGRAEYEMVRDVARFAAGLGMNVLAGHGLTYRNVRPVAQIPEIEELNIGHNIMARAILVGIETAVREMIALLA
jgi:pyridoxine 5-phosphate synthase